MGLGQVWIRLFGLLGFTFILGGSWVVISRVISRVTVIISH